MVDRGTSLPLPSSLALRLLGSLLFVAFVLLGAGSASSCGGFDPCDDKDCGQPCTLCEEGDNDCVEPPGSKTCNERGVCSRGAQGADSCGG